MEGDYRPGFFDPGPERVEVGVGGRAAGHWGRAEMHHPRPAIEGPLQLLQAACQVEEIEEGRSENPALVVEAPGFVEPPVEGPEVGVELTRVIEHEVLDSDTQRGQHDRRLDTLLVHQRQSRRAVDEFRGLASPWSAPRHRGWSRRT